MILNEIYFMKFEVRRHIVEDSTKECFRLLCHWEAQYSTGLIQKNLTIESQAWVPHIFMTFYFKVTIKLLLVIRWSGDRVLSKEADLFIR